MLKNRTYHKDFNSFLIGVVHIKMHFYFHYFMGGFLEGSPVNKNHKCANCSQQANISHFVSLPRIIWIGQIVPYRVESTAITSSMAKVDFGSASNKPFSENGVCIVFIDISEKYT